MARFHNLFFALRPPIFVSKEIDKLRHTHSLPGPWLPRAQLNISLLSLGRHSVLPLRLIERVSEVISQQQLMGSQIELDQFVSGRKSAFLASTKPLYDVERLQARLSECLAQNEIAFERWRSRPHLTLGYNVRAQPVKAISPLGWTANELVLIDSLYGEGKHLVQARWPLDAGGFEAVAREVASPIRSIREEQLSLFA